MQELDQLKRNHKQQATAQGATEVRLNRALEEIEKYKEQLSRSKTSSRVSLSVRELKHYNTVYI